MAFYRKAITGSWGKIMVINSFRFIRCFVIILLFTSIGAKSSWTNTSLAPNCFQDNSPRSYKVCLHPGAPNNSNTILYFHGLGGNEAKWGTGNHYSNELLNTLEVQGIPRPQVISISFGFAWFLVEKNTAPDSGLLEAFFDSILPKLEKLLPLAPTNYWIIGESMGGFNSLYSALFPQKFSAPISHVVSLCPAMVEMSPYDTRENQERIRKTIGMTQDKFFNYVTISKRFIGNHLEWLRLNPFQKVSEILVPQNTKFHVSCGTSDSWGFHLGAEKISKLLDETLTPTEWKSYTGEGHCAVHANDVANFLLN